jgi:hypothetical protein
MLREKKEIVLRRKLKPASIWTSPLFKRKQDSYEKLSVFGKLTSDKNLKLAQGKEHAQRKEQHGAP